jgi:DNA-binding transcriptional ArsR family regulator
MSRKSRNCASGRHHAHAPIFAALGDETRLLLVRKLSGGHPHSISQLTEGSKLTRQAITKHLRVLENAGIVHGVRRGRENLFPLDPEPIEEIKEYLDVVSQQWDQALARLKAFVEDEQLGHRREPEP